MVVNFMLILGLIDCDYLNVCLLALYDFPFRIKKIIEN